MVFSFARSACPLSGTPARMGYRPVSSAAREGAHTGAAAYQLVNRAPDVARPSMLGVFRSAAPQHPRSWQPRSSARMMMTFGGRRPAAAAIAAGVDASNSLRVSMLQLYSTDSNREQNVRNRGQMSRS